MRSKLGNDVWKLLQAINFQYDEKILYNTSQFYSVYQNRPVTIYTLKKAVLNEETGKSKDVELFSSASRLQIIYFLRDYLYELSGQAPPEPPDWWIEAKQKYYDKHNKDKE